MAAPSRPLFLLSNDDGYASLGLRALREELSAFGDVVTVAPETEQSATSHSLSLHRPLRLREVEPGLFALDGTPADCVYVALNSHQRILPRAPDVVISGINLGLNLGQDVFYSGTVAAAREGALRGLRALAVSAHTAAPHKPIGQLAGKIALAMMHRPKVAALTLLNLNVPAQWNGSVRVTRLGERLYDQGIDFRTDPRGREYLWIGGPGGVRHDPAPGTDTDAYDEGVASLTPLVLDLSAHAGETLAQNLVDSLEL